MSCDPWVSPHGNQPPVPPGPRAQLIHSGSRRLASGQVRPALASLRGWRHLTPGSELSEAGLMAALVSSWSGPGSHEGLSSPHFSQLRCQVLRSEHWGDQATRDIVRLTIIAERTYQLRHHLPEEQFQKIDQMSNVQQ